MFYVFGGGVTMIYMALINVLVSVRRVDSVRGGVKYKQGIV